MIMSFFGALNDWFGLTYLSAHLELVDSSKEPIEQSRADAPDENGDPIASKFFGNTSGALFDVSCTYALKSGTLLLSTILLGETEAGKVREACEVGTANTDWPQITLTGKIGTQTIDAPDGKLNTFALPAITIAGRKQAQLLGFTVSAGRLTASSLSASLEPAQQDDGVGEPAAHGVSGGTGTVSAELVKYNASAPAWTVTLADATQIKAPGANEGQAAFHNTTASFGFTLTRGLDE